MKWKIKAAIQALIEALPNAGKVNNFFQTKISRNLPVGADLLKQKLDYAQQHYQQLNNNTKDISAAIIYEFGAGYDLTIPIRLWMLGIKHQVVTDIFPLFDFRFFPSQQHMNFEMLEEYTRITSSGDLKERGIEYIAPLNPANTGFEGNRFDFIHSTDTLEHIPAKDIAPILKECYRLLKPGGIISCIIDLQDHYAYFDKSLSPFNFYRYNQKTWNRWYNNSLQYQNRLLADDYYDLFEEAGFSSIRMELETPSRAEIERLKQMRRSREFADKEIDELCYLRCHIVAKKRVE